MVDEGKGDQRQAEGHFLTQQRQQTAQGRKAQPGVVSILQVPGQQQQADLFILQYFLFEKKHRTDSDYPLL